MRYEFFLALAALPLWCGVSAAQTPRVELFAGYSHFGLRAEEGSGLTAADLNGWHAAAKMNLRPWFGLVADADGQYGERRLLPTRYQPRAAGPGSYRQHAILFGPEFRPVATGRFAVNLRALFGGTRVARTVLPLEEPFETQGTRITEFTYGWANNVTAVFGGSIDCRITDWLWYRIAQPEAVVTWVGSTYRTEFRVATGLVLRFGGL